jgi:hypothetical protein
VEAAIWGLLGTIVGALASIGTTFIQTRNTHALQRSVAQIEREERRRFFQRDTIVELQDTLHDLYRMVTRAFLEDEALFRKHGTWGNHPLSEEVNDGVRVLRRRLIILVGRVADDELRGEINAASEALMGMTMARTQEEATRLYPVVTSQGARIMERIGRGLRAQY